MPLQSNGLRVGIGWSSSGGRTVSALGHGFVKASPMRVEGIPLRVVAGDQVGEVNRYGVSAIARQSKAHAWCAICLKERRMEPWGPDQCDCSRTNKLRTEFNPQESGRLFRWRITGATLGQCDRSPRHSVRGGYHVISMRSASAELRLRCTVYNFSNSSVCDSSRFFPLSAGPPSARGGRVGDGVLSGRGNPGPSL